MNKEDEEIKLRDQCAIQIAQAVITANRNLISFITNTTGTNYPGNSNSNSNTIEVLGITLTSYLDGLLKEADQIADFSYKFADAMRKARLKSFT
jgi:hypothetical protein